MLTVFKPWRKGEDLKSVEMNWDEAFQAHPFSERETCYMLNFNIRYECLDAWDDYHAQMKKSEPTITGMLKMKTMSKSRTILCMVSSLKC